jgi:hypothetical protein
MEALAGAQWKSVRLHPSQPTKWRKRERSAVITPDGLQTGSDDSAAFNVIEPAPAYPAGPSMTFHEPPNPVRTSENLSARQTRHKIAAIRHGRRLEDLR